MSNDDLPEGFVKNQWKPGQSGNPKGRGKRPSFEAIVAGILDEAVPNTDTTKREGLARVFVDMMLRRNGQMIREYLDREWAKATKVEVELPGADIAGLANALDALASKRRAPRDDREPDGSAEGSSE